jgi:NAD(P)-dependent dehydrogenase (short-subunit alcohol dehydrogenase family)
MFGKLMGQTVIVTGGGRGFGENMCKAAAAEGANVVVADIDLDEAKRVAEAIQRDESTALALHVDVSDEARAKSMVEETLSHFGQVDVLVNDAGIAGPMGEMHTLSVEEWDRVFSVNVRGLFLCSKAVIPHMIERGSGHIVNISSSTTAGGFKIEHLRSFPYTTSKVCVNGVSHFLSMQVEKYGIRVNTLCPGLADTHFQEHTPPDYLKGRTCWNPDHTVGPLLHILTELEGTGHSIMSPDWHEERGTTEQFSYIHD